jgi:hypothetical protein
MTVLLQVTQLEPASPVRLFFVFLKTPAARHNGHVLCSPQDRTAAKMPALVPAIEFAKEVCDHSVLLLWPASSDRRCVCFHGRCPEA